MSCSRTQYGGGRSQTPTSRSDSEAVPKGHRASLSTKRSDGSNRKWNDIASIRPRHKKTGFLFIRKQGRRTAKVISSCAFATRIVTLQSISFLIRNFKPLAIFCGCTARVVPGLVGNFRRPVFSRHGSIYSHVNGSTDHQDPSDGEISSHHPCDPH